MLEHDIDKKVEELLTALGKELSNSRKAYVDAILDDNVPDPPFVMPSKVKEHSTKRRMKRILILIAVLIITLGILVISVEGVRVKFFNFFLMDQDGYTDLESLKQNENHDVV